MLVILSHGKFAILLIFPFILFLGAFCMFVIGGIEFYQLKEYENNRVEVTANLAGSKTEPEHILSSPGARSYQHSVRYSVAGQEIFAMPYFSKNESEKLLSEGKLKIVVLSNNPKRIILSEQELSNGSIWFILGFCLLLLSLFSWYLLRKEVAKDA